MKYIIKFLFILIFLASCKEITVETKSKHFNRINIFDSIQFEDNVFYPGITITDFRPENNTLLGFDWNSKDMIFINLQTKEIETINHFGGGPGEYEDIRGISFFNDSTIILLSFSKVLFFDIHGNFIKSKSLKFANIFQGFNLFKFNVPFRFNRDNDTIIYIRHFNNNTERGEYQKIIWLTEVNISGKSTKKCFKLDKNNQLYSLGNYRFDRATPSYSRIIDDSVIYFLYPFEPVIYFYNTNTYNLSGSIPFEIKSFKAIKFERKSPPEKSFRVSQLTDYCINFFITDNNMVLQYSEGIPENNIAKTRAGFIENEIDEKYRNEYLVFKNSETGYENFFLLRDKNNQKLRLLYVCSEKMIILLKSENNDEKNFKIFTGKI